MVVGCWTSRWPPVWETAVYLAVAGGVFDGVFLCCSYFPLDVLDEIWDVIESVSEGFLTYSCCAPRWYTKLMKPVYASLRMLGPKHSGYIDDSLIAEET